VLGLRCERGLLPFVTTVAGGRTRLYHGPLNNSAMQWYRDEKIEKGDSRLLQVANLGPALQESTLGFTLLDRHELLMEVVEVIDRVCGGRTKQHLFEHPYCRGFSELSIHDVGTSKAAAITVLQDMIGAKGPAALTVFGDNVNDIDMFKLAGRSVAPSNAVADVQGIATHIVASNDEDAKMPHSAFTGQTPDEMYLGTANSLPDELVVAQGKARERRLAVNRAVSCHRCAPATGPAAACNPP
jgi:hypothetical protein